MRGNFTSAIRKLAATQSGALARLQNVQIFWSTLVGPVLRKQVTAEDRSSPFRHRRPLPAILGQEPKRANVRLS